MKKIVFTLCFIVMTISVKAGETVKFPAKFDVVVAFGSMASGPSSDSFLHRFIKNFKKKYEVNLLTYKAAGCGREGEFSILISLAGARSNIKKKFISKLNASVLTEEKKNKAKDVNSGNITMEFNKTKNDFSHCREGINILR